MKMHRSIWWDAVSRVFFPALTRDLKVDVLVVGGGLTGVATAALLHDEGRSVALVTNGRIGDGTSGGTTAHITAQPDIGFSNLLAKFGLKEAQAVTEGLNSALLKIFTTQQTFGIDTEFEFVKGYKYTEESNKVEELGKEVEAARKLGIEATLSRETSLPFEVSAAMVIPNQARYQPLKFLLGLSAELSRRGVPIYENTRVLNYKDGSPCTVFTPGGVIEASSVVLATHTPIGRSVPIQTRVAPYNSYVLAARVRDTFESGIYWDTSEPYYYIRQYSKQIPNLVIVGGRDHKTGEESNTNSPFIMLETFLRKRFDVEEVTHYWSAELFEPVDGIPYIGRLPFSKNIYSATGYSGYGMTSGMLAAMILSDAIVGKANPWAEVFSPSRIKPLASAKELVSENLNVIKHFVQDRVLPPSQMEMEDIPVGEGAVLRLNGKEVAVYREDVSNYCILSPICTHMRGIVHWNSAEKSWDCPLHGGRYKPTGEIFYGPPLDNLSAEGSNIETQPQRILEPAASE